MNWTSLIGPAVVAAFVSAFVSGVVSVVGFFVSARTARSIHAERLVFDKKQAKELAEKNFELAVKTNSPLSYIIKAKTLRQPKSFHTE